MAVRRPVAAQGVREVELVERDGVSRLVERAEGLRPVLDRQRPRVLIAVAQDLARRVVVVRDLAAPVDQEGGRRQAREQVAREDQLQRAL